MDALNHDELNISFDLAFDSQGMRRAAIWQDALHISQPMSLVRSTAGCSNTEGKNKNEKTGTLQLYQ